jgi:hypothetical protein
MISHSVHTAPGGVISTILVLDREDGFTAGADARIIMVTSVAWKATLPSGI